jgi:choline dehydrogenase-like flavoprotein
MVAESALSAVLQATTLEALRTVDSHDVIIVGAGAAGGLAAMLLAEGGLRVLVLDAGPPLASLGAPFRRLIQGVAQRLSTPRALSLMPGSFIPKARSLLRRLGRGRQPIQSHCYAWVGAPDAFVDDLDCPYVTPPDRPFIWVRSRMLGGRVAVPGHGRQYYRLGPDDFAPTDGLSVQWPLQARDLEPWYALVERRLNLSGMRDGLPWLPDSELSNFLSPTQTEKTLQDKIIARWPGARPILGRYAPRLDALESAARTGRLLCRQGAVAREIHVDGSGNVSGVSWIDHETGSEQRSSAPLVFLCTSALESTRLLMLSRTPRTPQGLGANSGVLGHYLMDHVFVSAEGFAARNSEESPPEEGRCVYIPRFDSRESAAPGPGRGYGVQVYQFPVAGAKSYFVAGSFAEMLPRYENQVTLDPDRRDAWGIPVLRIDCAFSQVELARAQAQAQALRELAELAKVKLRERDETARPPGSAYHECGTARMGSNPGNSVLDTNNQCWDARGLYITDGACFPSQGYQNPTLTILALTARACQHALSVRGHEPGVTMALMAGDNPAGR